MVKLPKQDLKGLRRVIGKVGDAAAALQRVHVGGADIFADLILEARRRGVHEVRVDEEGFDGRGADGNDQVAIRDDSHEGLVENACVVGSVLVA